MADEKRSFEDDRFTVLKEKEERVLQKVAEITAELETQNTGGVLSSLLRNLKGILGHFTAEETPEQKQKREEEERKKREAAECEKIIQSSWHRFSYALSVDEMKKGLKTLQTDSDNEKLTTCIEKVKEVIRTKQEEELHQIVKKNMMRSYKLNPEDMETKLKEFTAKHTEDYLQPEIDKVKQVIVEEKKRIDIKECKALMVGDSAKMQQNLDKYKRDYNNRWTTSLSEDHLQEVYAEFEKAIETAKEKEDEAWAKELLQDINGSNYMSLPEYEKDFTEYTTHCKSQKYQTTPPSKEKIKKAIDAKKVQFKEEKEKLEDSVCTNLEHRIEQHTPTVSKWNEIKTIPLEYLAQNTTQGDKTNEFYNAKDNQADWATTYPEKYNEKLCGQIIDGNVKPCHLSEEETAANCDNVKDMDQYVKDMDVLTSLKAEDAPEFIQQKIHDLGTHIKQTLRRETKQPLITALQTVWETRRHAVLHKLELVDVQKDESWAEYEELEKEYEALVTEMTDEDLPFVPKPPDMKKEVQEAKNTRAIGAMARFTGDLSGLNTLSDILVSEGVPQTVFQTEYNAKVEALEKAATEAEIQEALRVREDFLTGITPGDKADGLLKKFKEFSGKVANDDVYKKENEIREKLDKLKKEELEAQCQQIVGGIKTEFDTIGRLTSDTEQSFRELLKKSQTDWETYKKARDASIQDWKCSGVIATVQNMICSIFDTNCQNVTTYLEERQADLTKFDNDWQTVTKAYEKMKAQFERADNKQLGNELLQAFLQNSQGINVEQTYKLIWADVQEILKQRKDQETVCEKEIEKISKNLIVKEKQQKLNAFKQGAGQHCPETDYAKIQRDIQTRRQMKTIMKNLLTSVDGLITTLKTTRQNQDEYNKETDIERVRLDVLYKAMQLSIKQSTGIIEKHAKETSDVRQSIEKDPIFEKLLKH